MDSVFIEPLEWGGGEGEENIVKEEREEQRFKRKKAKASYPESLSVAGCSAAPSLVMNLIPEMC